MKKSEKPDLIEFMFAEANGYGRTLTQPEIETYFENLPSHSLADVKRAWIDHKRGDKGHFFPRLIDLQRALKSAGEGATSKDDPRCVWNGNGSRCCYPVGMFQAGARDGFCIFHRGLMSGAGAQEICDESQSHYPEQYVERAKRRIYGTTLPKSVTDLQAQIARVRATGNRANLFSTVLLPPPEPAPEPVVLDDVNALAQLAAADGE